MKSINVHVTLFPFYGSAPEEKYDRPIFKKLWQNIELSSRFIEDLVHHSVSLDFDPRHQNQTAKVTRYGRVENTIYVHARMSSPSSNYVSGLIKDGWQSDEALLEVCGLPVSEACAELYKPVFETRDTLTPV